MKLPISASIIFVILLISSTAFAQRKKTKCEDAVSQDLDYSDDECREICQKEGINSSFSKSCLIESFNAEMQAANTNQCLTNYVWGYTSLIGAGDFHLDMRGHNGSNKETSYRECQRTCRETEGCYYFQFYTNKWGNSSGKCVLKTEDTVVKAGSVDFSKPNNPKICNPMIGRECETQFKKCLKCNDKYTCAFRSYEHIAGPAHCSQFKKTNKCLVPLPSLSLLTETPSAVTETEEPTTTTTEETTTTTTEEPTTTTTEEPTTTTTEETTTTTTEETTTTTTEEPTTTTTEEPTTTTTEEPTTTTTEETTTTTEEPTTTTTEKPTATTEPKKQTTAASGAQTGTVVAVAAASVGGLGAVAAAAYQFGGNFLPSTQTPNFPDFNFEGEGNIDIVDVEQHVDVSQSFFS